MFHRFRRSDFVKSFTAVHKIHTIRSERSFRLKERITGASYSLYFPVHTFPEIVYNPYVSVFSENMAVEAVLHYGSGGAGFV